MPLQLLAPGGHIVLVGDPKQLPPTVLSRAAESSNLAQSLFERLQQVCELVNITAAVVLCFWMSAYNLVRLCTPEYVAADIACCAWPQVTASCLVTLALTGVSCSSAAQTWLEVQQKCISNSVVQLVSSASCKCHVPLPLSVQPCNGH